MTLFGEVSIRAFDHCPICKQKYGGLRPAVPQKSWSTICWDCKLYVCRADSEIFHFVSETIECKVGDLFFCCKKIDGQGKVMTEEKFERGLKLRSFE